MIPIEQFFDKIASFVLEQNGLTPVRHQNAIKQHTEKLRIFGDIGFTTTLQAWLHLQTHDINGGADATRKITDKIDEEEFLKKLFEIGSEFGYPIERAKFRPFRCSLFLNREQCTRYALKAIISDGSSFGKWHQSNGKKYRIDVQKHEENHLSVYRCATIAKVSVNLLKASGFEVIESENKEANVGNLVDILVTHAKRNNSETADDPETNNNAEIICGAVRSRRGYTVEDFIELRSNEMAKLAQLKYGSDKDDIIPYDYNKLGAAIVTFDLLKTKHINTIDFDRLCDQKPTIKGAAFILYNVARLQKLLHTFDAQVSIGFYQPLPELEQIDFGLLKEEEEWQMLYVYIISFPTMLERCIGGIDDGHASIHLLCTFLNNLAASFSVYYHRIKILTDNLPQLTPVMSARIYLLKGLRSILLKSLSILEIEPINEM